MGKNHFRIVGIILCIALIIPMCYTTAAIDTDNNYYVINGGTGDGRTVSNPAPSVLDVINTINEDGHTEEDTVNVYIMQRDDYNVTPANKYHYITYWAKDGAIPATHKARIVVRPFEPTISTALCYVDEIGAINKVMHLSGPTTFKGIKIVAPRYSYNSEIYTHGNDFTIERDVTFGSIYDSATISHQYSDSFCLDTWYGGSTYNEPVNIEYKAPTIAGGPIYINNKRGGQNVTTFKEDVNLTIDNATLGSHETISFPITFGGNTVINKNLNINLKKGDKIAFAALEGTSVTAYGGIQIIKNSMLTCTAPIGNLSCFSSNTKIWDISLEPLADNTLSFTSVAGTYTVQDGVTLIATNENGDTVTSSNQKLTLKAGVWTVTKKTIVHNGDSNSDGEINVIDLVNLKKRIADNSSYYPLSDANCDNTINSSDLITVKRHLLGSDTISWKNYDINLAKANNLSGGSDEEAEELKNFILNSPDTIVAKGTTYYVSEDGSDNNNGTSRTTPIRISKVNSLSLKSGDAVLFERGGIFRISEAITPKSGVSYGAYGEGEKPRILGSVRDYADPAIWSSDDGVLWVTDIAANDASNIIFNYGEYHGIKKTSIDKVKQDGDFYFDPTEKKVYLYLSQHNPGYYFDSIEMANSSFIFRATGSGNSLIHDITIENICTMYPATHAFSLNYGKNLTVQNCEIAWVGGAWFGTSGGQLGNAIEFWDIADGNTVSNNYIHQVFDAAVTFQGSNYNDYTNLTIKNNLIEYCSMNFEFWASDSNNSDKTSSDLDATIKNIWATDNIFRFGGYGFGALQRNEKSNQAFVLNWFNIQTSDQVKNVNITDNIFDTANCFFFYGPNMLHLFNISNNSYYQQNGSDFPFDRSGDYYCEDQKTLEVAVKERDKNSNHIEWIE